MAGEIEVLAISSDLWETVGMKTPHLEILSEADDPVLKGKRSSCDATFSLSSGTESALALIHGMFSEHLHKVHTRKDAEAIGE